MLAEILGLIVYSVVFVGGIIWFPILCDIIEAFIKSRK